MPAGRPGDLIRSQDFDDYDLPMDVSVVRILYHSRSGNGKDVATSGVVLFPVKKAPAGGWPVIAWAHDLNGVARTCAPSLMRNLRHGPFLSMYVQLGYAIVATDYAGLGSKERNAFADMTSNAYDVIYSIPAARKAVPQLGERWVAMGTVEGGMAVLTVAELEHGMRDPNFLGAVAISRTTDISDQYPPLNTTSHRMPLFLSYGIATIYPEFRPADILTSKGLDMFGHVAETCASEGTQPEFSAPEMVKTNWQENSFVQRYFERNRLGLKPADRPLLILGSEEDSTISQTASAVSRLCKQGDHVQFEKFPGQDSGSLMGDSVRDQISWMERVFSGKAAPDDCKSLR
ncbi:MAG TPA: lipase family protein [Candidatus Sulfotelmatobacter sp.]|nr:lipase family protein [Candidatus Sulfotelmatobacter sp.]